MRYKRRPRHALVLAVVATLTAAVIPTTAYAAGPGDDAASDGTVQAAATDAADANEEADGDQPDASPSPTPQPTDEGGPGDDPSDSTPPVPNESDEPATDGVDPDDSDPADEDGESAGGQDAADDSTGGGASDDTSSDDGASAGDTPADDASSDDASSDDASSGDASSGDASSGDASSGDTSSGDASSGDGDSGATLEVIDSAGTKDPRFEAAKISDGTTLSQAEMDKIAMSTGEDQATLDGGPLIEKSLAGFNPANIISDSVFYDGSTMSAAQIRDFLRSKVPSCQSGYTCLPDYTENTRSRAADTYCKGYTGASGESSARIIYKVAQSCDINPKALIVILQKEQGLVTHTWPSDWRYTIAMGMACPDTSACDSEYYGFQNQVYSAARQYQVYSKSSYFSWYPVGSSSNVRYHPDTSCGSSPVTIANKATAALYYYTPYQPNSAALAAGYGTGDGCSSYGNRNFYNYFTDWFGSTHTSACTVPSGATKAVRQYVVNVSGLNARKAPSTACDSGVISLSKGTLVQATRLSADKDWLEVVTNSGRRWVSRQYLVYATAAQSCTVPIGSTTAVRQYVTTTGVNARKAPNSDCDSQVFTLSPGSILQATKLSADKKWLEVATNSGRRWVSREYVRYASATEGRCTEPSGTSKAIREYVVMETVDAKLAPWDDCGEGSRHILSNTMVQATQVSYTGRWLEVQTGVGKRWLKRSSVKLCMQPEGTGPASRQYLVNDGVDAEMYPMLTCGTGVKRFGPGTSPSKYITDNVVVQATRISHSGDWLRIRTSEGERWVARDEVMVCPEPTGTRSTSNKYVVSESTAAVVSPLETCGSGASHFGTGTAPKTLSAGTVLQATRISYTGNWIKVETSAGLRWVKSADLKRQ